MIKREKTRKTRKKWRLASLAASGGGVCGSRGGGRGQYPPPPLLAMPGVNSDGRDDKVDNHQNVFVVWLAMPYIGLTYEKTKCILRFMSTNVSQCVLKNSDIVGKSDRQKSFNSESCERNDERNVFQLTSDLANAMKGEE